MIQVPMLLILIGLTITANANPDAYFSGEIWEPHKLSDLGIVQKIYILNYICGSMVAIKIADFVLRFTDLMNKIVPQKEIIEK